MFQNFKHQIATLHCSKKLTNPMTLTVFITTKKYIFNVRQITTSGGKLNIFWGVH